MPLKPRPTCTGPTPEWPARTPEWSKHTVCTSERAKRPTRGGTAGAGKGAGDGRAGRIRATPNSSGRRLAEGKNRNVAILPKPAGRRKVTRGEGSKGGKATRLPAGSPSMPLRYFDRTLTPEVPNRSRRVHHLFPACAGPRRGRGGHVGMVEHHLPMPPYQLPYKTPRDTN